MECVVCRECDPECLSIIRTKEKKVHLMCYRCVCIGGPDLEILSSCAHTSPKIHQTVAPSQECLYLFHSLNALYKNVLSTQTSTGCVCGVNSCVSLRGTSQIIDAISSNMRAHRIKSAISLPTMPTLDRLTDFWVNHNNDTYENMPHPDEDDIVVFNPMCLAKEVSDTVEGGVFKRLLEQMKSLPSLEMSDFTSFKDDLTADQLLDVFSLAITLFRRDLIQFDVNKEHVFAIPRLARSRATVLALYKLVPSDMYLGMASIGVPTVYRLLKKWTKHMVELVVPCAFMPFSPFLDNRRVCDFVMYQVAKKEYIMPPDIQFSH